MATWEDITDGRRLSESIVVTVANVTRGDNDHLDWVLTVEDKDGRGFQLKIWTTHGIDRVWETGHRYELEEALGKIKPDGTRILSSTDDLEISELGGDVEQETKILAISDTHFGYKHRGDYDQEWQANADGVGSFQRVANLAISRNVDAIIHAGDVFDDQGEVTKEDKQKIRRILLKLGQHFIPVCYILGNHEIDIGEDILKQSEQAGETVHLTPEGHTVYDSSVGLYGVGKDISVQPATNVGFPSDPDTRTNILVMHHDLAPVRESGDVNLAEITSTGPEFDFVISGDLHDAECHWWGDTRVLYTGATDHLSVKFEDNNPSAWLLTIKGNDITSERLPLDKQ